jgi:hypothetical protein
MCRSVQNYGRSRFMCKGNAFQPTSSMAQKKIEYAQGLFSWMNLKNTSSKKSYRTFFPEVKYKTKFTVPHCTSVIQFSFFFSWIKFILQQLIYLKISLTMTAETKAAALIYHRSLFEWQFTYT